jgi:dihydroflavonol-4-reductase
MEVLVTGATGYLGQAVCRLLLQRGDKVRALVLPTADLTPLEGLELELKIGDVTDRGTIARAARGVEVVVHAAAQVSIQSRELEHMRYVNVHGVENVASVALEVAARRLVHVSSILAIGGGRDATPVDESHSEETIAQQIPYVATKRDAERIAFQYARHKMDVVVVNPTVMVGAPDYHASDPAGIIRYLQRKIPGCLDRGLNLVDVWDVAAGILQAIDSGRSGERYILGGENFTFAEFYALLEDISEVPAPRMPVPYPMARMLSRGLSRMSRFSRGNPLFDAQMIQLLEHWWLADSSKAMRELGYRPGPVRQALEKAITYYRERKLV